MVMSHRVAMEMAKREAPPGQIPVGVVAGLLAMARQQDPLAIAWHETPIGSACLSSRGAFGAAIPVPLETWHRETGRFSVLAGPNQGGKTYAGAKEAIWELTGLHPFREGSEEPTHGWVICYSQKQSLSVQKTLYNLIPRHLVVGLDYNDSRGFLNRTLYIRHKSGGVSKLEIKTAGQDTLGLASATLDFIWVDEPPPQEIWSELMARLLVKGGRLWVTMTPIGRPVEWLKELCDSGDLDYVRFSLDVDACPHLSQTQINDIVGRYLESERDQRAHGLWHGVTPDRFIATFDPKKHVIRKVGKSKRFRVGVWMDHGEGAGKQTAVLALIDQHPRYPRAWIIDEYVSQTATDYVMDAIAILDMLESHHMTPYHVDYWVGDTNSAGKGHVGASVNELLAFHLADQWAKRKGMGTGGGTRLPRIEIDSADKSAGSVDWGCRVMSYAFKSGSLFVHERCKKLLYCLAHWRGPHLTAGENKALGHIIDGFRYGLVEAFRDYMEYGKLRIE